MRARKAVVGFENTTQQEIALLYDPDVVSAVHDPRDREKAPRFDGTFAIDVDTDAAPDQITWSKPPLEIALTIPTGRVIRLIGVHAKSKALHSARNDAEASRMSIENRRKQLAQCIWLRKRVDAHLEAGDDLIVLGDFNDGTHAVSSEIISGEAPFKNYAWMRRHDAEHKGDRYTDKENELISAQINARRLHSAEKLFVRKSARDMIYTSAFGGMFESIDQIFMSAHFQSESADHIGEIDYFSVLNDHLTDGSHPEAPYNKLASDHGQIMAHFTMRDKKQS